MRVLVVGATGNFAGLVVPELVKRGAAVRALIHDESKAEDAKKRGASEVVVGDLQDKAFLKKAVSGVEGVFHINPAFVPNEAEIGVAMVDAAKGAGVRKFVFSGVIHPSVSALTNHSAKLPVEEAIYQSGLEYTVLQPTMFMQTIDSGWQQVLKKGVFALPFSKKQKVSYVDYRDVAEAAAMALTSDRLSYGTFELCADGMVDRTEIAKLMGRAIGRKVEAAEPPFEEWAEAAKIPSGPMREGMERMYADYDAHGFPGGNALVLRAILEREPRTLAQYLQELAGRQGELAA